MLPEINIKFIEASQDYRQYYAMVVRECVKLRKKRKHTINYLAENLAITRQRLSRFEKLKVHDIAIASNYLEYYNRYLTLSIQNL